MFNFLVSKNYKQPLHLSIWEMEKYHFHSQFKKVLGKKDGIKGCQQCDETKLAGIVIGKTFEKSNLAVSIKTFKLSISLNQTLLLYDLIPRNKKFLVFEHHQYIFIRLPCKFWNLIILFILCFLNWWIQCNYCSPIKGLNLASWSVFQAHRPTKIPQCS